MSLPREGFEAEPWRKETSEHKNRDCQKGVYRVIVRCDVTSKAGKNQGGHGIQARAQNAGALDFRASAMRLPQADFGSGTMIFS